MKVAKLNPEFAGEIGPRNYFLVNDDYDFEVNNTTDVSLPSTFEICVIKGFLEYGIYRSILTEKFIPIWSELTFEERQICVKYFKYPIDITNEEYTSYFTAEEDESNWGELISQTTGKFIIQSSVRGKRLVAMVKKITYKLAPAQIVPIAATTIPLMFSYTIGNFPHLGLWIFR